MPESAISITVNRSGIPVDLRVFPIYNPELFCSYKVTDADGYLFTLVPANDSFTDFELSEMDQYIDHPVDPVLLERVKLAVINYYL
jgi:hypothetical protein